LRILDAGCGAGGVARYLARRGGVVTGVDISEVLLARARAEEEAEPLRISYLAQDLVEDLPFAEGEFDIALSVMAIMDVEDPIEALRNVGSTVRMGGVLVFSILHPCFYRPRFTPDGTGVDVAHYFDRGRVEWRYIRAEDGARAEYRQFHRTLGDYLNTLADGGFSVARFVEPGDTRVALLCRRLPTA